jgi:hypothetical protein
MPEKYRKRKLPRITGAIIRGYQNASVIKRIMQIMRKGNDALVEDYEE